jgi:hypothetical protein
MIGKGVEVGSTCLALWFSESAWELAWLAGVGACCLWGESNLLILMAAVCHEQVLLVVLGASGQHTQRVWIWGLVLAARWALEGLTWLILLEWGSAFLIREVFFRRIRQVRIKASLSRYHLRLWEMLDLRLQGEVQPFTQAQLESLRGVTTL